MPFYVADYLADTRHLTPTQHGAYLLLILEYWQRGSLPADDEEKLARLAGMQSREWLANRDVLAKFFAHPGWGHKRIDAEIAKTADLSEKRKNSVNARKDRQLTNVVPLKGK
jgi:uncharacterized protein YdaU (DUF1376 family)